MLFQVHAFVAPKIIGGKNAPSPVGELGMVEMSQALELIDVNYEQVINNAAIVIFVVYSKSKYMTLIASNRRLVLICL